MLNVNKDMNILAGYCSNSTQTMMSLNIMILKCLLTNGNCAKRYIVALCVVALMLQTTSGALVIFNAHHPSF